MIKITLNGMRDADADRGFMGFVRLNVDDKVYLDAIKVYKDDRQDNGIAIVTPANKVNDKYYPFYKITSKAFTDMLRDCIIQNIINSDNKEFVYNAGKEENIGLYVHPESKKADMLISGKLCIDSFRIMKNNNSGSLFISMPSIKRKGENGDTEYERVVTISKTYKEEFNSEVLDKYNKYAEKQIKNSPKPEEGQRASRI